MVYWSDQWECTVLEGIHHFFFVFFSSFFIYNLFLFFVTSYQTVCIQVVVEETLKLLELFPDVILLQNWRQCSDLVIKSFIHKLFVIIMQTHIQGSRRVLYVCRLKFLYGGSHAYANIEQSTTSRDLLMWRHGVYSLANGCNISQVFIGNNPIYI